MIGPGPGDVRRPEEGQHGDPERGGEVSRPRVGRDQQRRAPDAGLRQADREGLIGQADDSGVGGPGRDLAGRVAFARPADDEHGESRLVGEAMRQAREVLHRPVLGRTERPPRVQADHGRVPVQSQLRPGPVGRRFIGLGGEELGADRVHPAPQPSGDRQVRLDDRGRQEPPRPVASGLQPVGQEEAAASPGIADATSSPRPPGHQRRAEGVGEQDGQLGALVAQTLQTRPACHDPGRAPWGRRGCGRPARGHHRAWARRGA